MMVIEEVRVKEALNGVRKADRKAVGVWRKDRSRKRVGASSGLPAKVELNIGNSVALVVDNFDELFRRKLARSWQGAAGHWVGLLRSSPGSPVNAGGRVLVRGAKVTEAKAEKFTATIKKVESRGAGAVLGVRHQSFWLEGEARRSFRGVKGLLWDLQRLRLRSARLTGPYALLGVLAVRSAEEAQRRQKGRA